MPLWSFEGARTRPDLTLSAVIAAGVHLFPFRTEKLSPPAPMVLGARAPGRVGRRRIELRKGPDVSLAPSSFQGARRRLAPFRFSAEDRTRTLREPDLVAREALCGSEPQS